MVDVLWTLMALPTELTAENAESVTEISLTAFDATLSFHFEVTRKILGSKVCQ